MRASYKTNKVEPQDKSHIRHKVNNFIYMAKLNEAQLGAYRHQVFLHKQLFNCSQSNFTPHHEKNREFYSSEKKILFLYNTCC